MSPRRGIFRRYALVVSVAMVGTLLAYGLVEIAFVARENLQRVREFHISEVRALSGRVASIFDEIERNLTAVASSPWGRGLAVTDRMAEYYRTMRLLPVIRDVAVFDESGKEIFFVSRTEPERVASGRRVDSKVADWTIPGEAYFGELQRERAGSAPIVQLALRDTRHRRELTVATLNLQFISDELARMHRSGDEMAYVVDQRGRLVAHFDVSRPLRADGVVHFGADAKEAIEEGGRWRRANDGAYVLTVWQRLRNPSWTIVVDSPWQQAVQSVLDTAYRTLAFIVIASLLALLISRYLANRLVQPVMALRAGAEALGSGGMQHRIALSTGDELEELGGKFNEMAEQVQAYTTGLEQKVEERTEKLQQAMRTRALFLAAASHDLRQPLYAISILADTLAMQALPEGARHALAKQREAIKVLRELFDNLLDLSRFDTGETRAVLRTVSLREILMSVAMEHEVVSRANGLTWTCEIPDVQVTTDPELMRRLLGNLLSNAVRYTREGGVSLRGRVDRQVVVLEVADTGIGIPPELQARVFEEFVQLDNAHRDRDRGVGLGLSIVKKIDGLLGSRLRLESAPGKGTRMTVEIPLAIAQAEPVPAASAIDVEAVDLAGMRVWMVEDDPMVRDALARQFAAWEVDYAFASTRVEVAALRVADGDWPDAAMLDDMLGHGERGLDIARWLASEMPKQRILLVTGNVEPAAAQALDASGFKVLRKPLSAVVLVQWLRSVRRPPKAPRSDQADALAG